MSRTATPRILIVEDDREIAEVIRDNLLEEGCQADIAADGRAGLEAALHVPYDLLILDVMLPHQDGFTVCEALRREGRSLPILFLTARDGREDRVRGLEVGGDDYLPKPFHLRELLLRVRGLLQRGHGRHEAPTVHFGGNRVDLERCRAVAWNGTEYRLDRREVAVLETLLEHEGEVVDPQKILETVWRGDVLPSTRTVRRLVADLARRFEPDPEHPRHFHDLPGEGFLFTRQPRERS